MKTEYLFKGVAIKAIKGVMPEEVAGVTDKAGEVKNGFCFFAIKGEKYNGADFIGEAADNGASIIVTEDENVEAGGAAVVMVDDIREVLDVVCKRFYLGDNPKIKLIGVVGTNGKTSVCHIIYEIFAYAGKKAAYLGTIGGKIGEKEYETSLTTPGRSNCIVLSARRKKRGRNISRSNFPRTQSRRREVAVFITNV